MCGMLSRRSSYAYVLLALLVPAFATTVRSEQARTVSFTAESGCEIILASIDEARAYWRAQPSSTFSVIAYPARTTPAGKVLQHLRFIEKYLRMTQGATVRAEQVVVGVGPVRERFLFEICVVPPETPVPRSDPFPERYPTRSGMLDEGPFGVARYEGKWALDSEICSLEKLAVREFAEAVAAVPRSRGFVVIYPGTLRSQGGSAGPIAAVGAELLAIGLIGADRVRFVVGPRRSEFPTAELWVVPAGVRPPKAR
jgi:hypothetical protein